MGRKERGSSPRQKKIWVELKKRAKERTDFIKNQSTPYVISDYDKLMGNSNAIKKNILNHGGKVQETWQEKMDREAEEMYEKSERMCDHYSDSRKKWCDLTRNHTGEHSYNS